LRSYAAVLWQGGFETYPPFSASQRDTIGAYLGGGGRLATIGHDIGWGLAPPGAPGHHAAGPTRRQNTLHLPLLQGPQWSRPGGAGVRSDPISGAYTGGIDYVPFRDGGAGDEIAITGSGGSGSYDWLDNLSPPGDDGFRWEDSAPSGSPATAFWGGTRSRIAQ